MLAISVLRAQVHTPSGEHRGIKSGRFGYRPLKSGFPHMPLPVQFPTALNKMNTKYTLTHRGTYEVPGHKQG